MEAMAQKSRLQSAHPHSAQHSPHLGQPVLAQQRNATWGLGTGTLRISWKSTIPHDIYIYIYINLLDSILYIFSTWYIMEYIYIYIIPSHPPTPEHPHWKPGDLDFHMLFGTIQWGCFKIGGKVNPKPKTLANCATWWTLQRLKCWG